MSDFCRHHGFYAPCPSCTGEEVIWEIPIVDCAGGGGVDVFRMSAGVYEDAMAAPDPSLPLVRHMTVNVAPSVEPPPYSPAGMPAARDHVPVTANPGLLAKVRLLLQG